MKSLLVRLKITRLSVKLLELNRDEAKRCVAFMQIWNYRSNSA